MKTHTTLTVLLAVAAISLTAGCEGVEAETPYETTQHALRGDAPIEIQYPSWAAEPNLDVIQALAPLYATTPAAPAELSSDLRTWEEENPLPTGSEGVPQYEPVDPTVVLAEQDWYAPTPLEDGVVRTQEDWYSN